MVFVIVWLFYHFTLKSTPLVNGVCIITFVSHLHVWVAKFKPSLMFFKLPILTSNNVVWVSLFTIFFDETQHVGKTPTTGYMPVVMRSSIYSLSLKIFCSYFSFINSKLCNTLQQCLLIFFAFGC